MLNEAFEFRYKRPRLTQELKKRGPIVNTIDNLEKKKSMGLDTNMNEEIVGNADETADDTLVLESDEDMQAAVEQTIRKSKLKRRYKHTSTEIEKHIRKQLEHDTQKYKMFQTLCTHLRKKIKVYTQKYKGNTYTSKKQAIQTCK